MSSLSPSGGMKEMVRSFSKRDRRTHWWNFTSSSSTVLLFSPDTNTHTKIESFVHSLGEIKVKVMMTDKHSHFISLSLRQTHTESSVLPAHSAFFSSSTKQLVLLLHTSTQFVFNTCCHHPPKWNSLISADIQAIWMTSDIVTPAIVYNNLFSISNVTIMPPCIQIFFFYVANCPPKY